MFRASYMVLSEIYDTAIFIRPNISVFHPTTMKPVTNDTLQSMTTCVVLEVPNNEILFKFDGNRERGKYRKRKRE